MKSKKLHPLCEMFPRIDADELKELSADIAANGLREEIVLLDGLVLDGQNRLAACEVAGIKPKFSRYTGTDPVAYVISKNLKRRHLTTSQRSMIAAELATGKHGGDRKSDQVANLQLASQAERAEQLQVSPRNVSMAVKVKGKSKALARQVKDGKTTLRAAAKKAGILKVPPTRPPRGGFAAEAREAAEESKPVKSNGSGLLAKLDAWWKENSARLSSYPAAAPKAVFNEIRKIVENAE